MPCLSGGAYIQVMERVQSLNNPLIGFDLWELGILRVVCELFRQMKAYRPSKLVHPFQVLAYGS